MASPPSFVPVDFSESSDPEEQGAGDDTILAAGSPGEGLSLEPLSSLRFWYVDPAGQSVLEKDSAAVTVTGGRGHFLCVHF